MTQEQRMFIDQLAQLHGRRMAQLTYRRLGDHDTTKDIVQETFLIACCKVKEVYEHENPPGWLYLTLHNLTRRELNRRKREVICDDIQSLPVFVEDDLPMELFLPNTLSEKDRELLLMRLRDGMSFEEIAARRGISEVACRQQMSRASRRCREALLKRAQSC